MLESLMPIEPIRSKVMTEPEAYRVCSNYGIMVADWEFARNREEAISAGSKLGLPVALKVVSRDIVHKSDYGGVMLDLRDSEDVGNAYDRALKNAREKDREARIDGVLVQRHVQDATELIVGVSRNDQFGPVVAFGGGGIFVELLDDTALRVAPLDEEDATEMIFETRVSKLLTGARGRPRRNIEAIIDTLVKVSRIALDKSDILEIDLNPVMATQETALVADARIIVG